MTDEAAAAGGGRYVGEGLIPDVAADTIAEMLHGRRSADVSVSAAAAAGGTDPRAIRGSHLGIREQQRGNSSTNQIARMSR